MTWVGLLGNKVVSPLPEGIKLTSAKYVEYLTDHFPAWLKKKNHAFWG